MTVANRDSNFLLCSHSTVTWTLAQCFHPHHFLWLRLVSVCSATFWALKPNTTPCRTPLHLWHDSAKSSKFRDICGGLWRCCVASSTSGLHSCSDYRQTAFLRNGLCWLCKWELPLVVPRGRTLDAPPNRSPAPRYFRPLLRYLTIPYILIPLCPLSCSAPRCYSRVGFPHFWAVSGVTGAAG